MAGGAGEGEVVDVGGAVVGPFGDVVGLAEVSGDVAAWVGAAASPAIKSSIDSAQTASTAASTTSIEPMFEHQRLSPTAIADTQMRAPASRSIASAATC